MSFPNQTNSIGTQALIRHAEVTSDPTGFVISGDPNVVVTVGGVDDLDITVAAASGTAEYFYKGHRRLLDTTGKSVTATESEGMHLFCIDEDDNLIEVLRSDYSSSLDFLTYIMRDVILIAIGHRNSDDAVWSYPLLRETHGCSMGWAEHLRLHSGDGPRFMAGFDPVDLVVDGSDSDDASIEVGWGACVSMDEDISHVFPGCAAGTAQYLFYKDGQNWRTAPQSNWPVMYPGRTLADGVSTYGGATAAYNYIDPATGDGSLVDVGNNDFSFVFCFLLSSQTPEIAWVLGQNKYTTAARAYRGIKTELRGLDLRGMPTPEFNPIGVFLVKTNSGWSNSAKSIFVHFVDEFGEDVNWKDLQRHHGNTPS